MDTIEGTHAYELRSQPLANLSQRAMVDFFSLARLEVQATRLAFVQKARAATLAGRSFGLAAVCGVVALTAAGAALALGLATILAPWLAALLVAVVFGAVAIAFTTAGRGALARATAALPGSSFASPLATGASLPEDATLVAQAIERAKGDLERTVAILEQRSTTASPVRDAALAGIGVAIGAAFQAREGRRS